MTEPTAPTCAQNSPEKPRGLLGASVVVGLGTLASRVLGLVRDVVLAMMLGAGGSADAFFVAFKIPNFLRRLFAEGAFSQAFVPVLAQYRQQRVRLEVQQLVAQVATLMFLILLLVSLLGMLAAPGLAWLFAPGFSDQPAKLALTVDLLRLTFPYILFISLVALSAGVMNTYGHYATPALTPVLLNISLIFGALVMSGWFAEPAMGLAWAVLLAGLLQCVAQLPMLWRLGFLQRPRLSGQGEGVKQMLALMAPALFGVSVAQINLLLDTVLASFLADGAVGWLYYADRLSELPLGLIGIALGTVILPVLARAHQLKSNQDFRQTLAWALRLVWLVGLPASAALVFLALPLISGLFLYGAMTPYDSQQAARALMAYGLGLPAFMLVKVLAPGWYARHDTKTPVKIAIQAMGLSMALNLILIWPLGHVGLALSTAIAAWFNAGALWYGLQRQGLAPSLRGMLQDVWRPGLASALMLGLLWLGVPEPAWWLSAAFGPKLLGLLALVAVGGLGYLLFIFLFGVRWSWLRVQHQ